MLITYLVFTQGHSIMQSLILLLKRFKNSPIYWSKYWWIFWIHQAHIQSQYVISKLFAYKRWMNSEHWTVKSNISPSPNEHCAKYLKLHKFWYCNQSSNHGTFFPWPLHKKLSFVVQSQHLKVKCLQVTSLSGKFNSIYVTSAHAYAKYWNN